MHDWMGIGLFAVGLGLLVAAVVKQRNRQRSPVPAGAIRPEFAAMGEIVRPLILFVVALFAVKMSAFYFLLGGQRYLTPLDFAGILFVLACYCGWLVVATRRRSEQPVERPVRGTVQAGEPSTI
jgi:hypothetical protein